MFEDNELSLNTPIDKTCSFCNKLIKQIPAQSIDGKLTFCDVICAKLYYDNIEHFTFNMKHYNDCFAENQLSRNAASIYERARHIIFEQLPIYKPRPDEPEYNNPDLMHKRYKNILTPVLLKSIGVYDG